MKKFAPLFAFLFLGSLALGQTTTELRPGGVFTITSPQALCGIPTSVAIVGVNRALAEPLPVVLGGCRVRVTQVATGEHVASLQLAHTLFSPFPGARPGWTAIVGVVPQGLVAGSASLIIEKLEPRALDRERTEWVVVSSTTMVVEVGRPADRPAQLSLVGDTAELKIE